MSNNTDFEDWLAAGNEPDTPEERYALHKAAQGESFGIYDVTDKNGQRFIKGPEGTLALVTEKAVKAFQKRVDDFMPEPELGWEGGNYYLHAMAKDD